MPSTNIKNRLSLCYFWICFSNSIVACEKPTKFKLYCYLYLFHILQYTFQIEKVNRISMYNTKNLHSTIFTSYTRGQHNFSLRIYKRKSYLSVYLYYTLSIMIIYSHVAAVCIKGWTKQKCSQSTKVYESNLLDQIKVHLLCAAVKSTNCTNNTHMTGLYSN